MKRFFGGSVEPLGELEVLVVASTEQVARDGHVLVQAGLDLKAYRQNQLCPPRKGVQGFLHRSERPSNRPAAAFFGPRNSRGGQTSFRPK
jgi:hypothetical protein